VNQTVQPHNDVFEKFLMAGLFVLIALLVVVWAGAQLATLVTHGHPLHTTFQQAGDAMLAMRDHMGDPRSAWLPEQRDQLPGPILYWLSTVVAMVAGIGVAYLAWKVFRDPTESLDPRRRAGVSAQGRLAKPMELGPLLIRRPVPGRFVLGRVGRRLIATEAVGFIKRRRRSSSGPGAVMPVGPSRSGKTTNIINGVFEWRHPAILVSLKNDFLDATGNWRGAWARSRSLTRAA
jgi:hypothetical protein